MELKEERDHLLVGEIWSSLAHAGRNIFGTPEWCLGWARHSKADPQIWTVRRDDGSVASVLPLAITRIGEMRVAKFLGDGPSDQTGPLCKEADRAVVGAAIRRALDGEGCKWDVLVASPLDQSENWHLHLDCDFCARFPTFVAEFPQDGWNGYLATRSAHMRKRLRYIDRRLRRSHRVDVRVINDLSELERAFDTLVRLHRMRWGERSGSFAGYKSAFHRDFASVALRRGWLRLWLAEVDDRDVAALYAFRFGNVEAFYQAGRDPDWNRYEVGTWLLSQAMRDAADAGISEFRFLRGIEQYKRRFATTARSLDHVAVARPGLSRSDLHEAVKRPWLDPSRIVISARGRQT